MAVPAMLGHGRDARGTKCKHLNQNRSNSPIGYLGLTQPVAGIRSMQQVVIAYPLFSI